MTILVEVQTTNEFYYLKSVLEKLHKEGALIIFFCRNKITSSIKELILNFFPQKPPVVLDIFWINKFPKADFYINATQSYDIQVPLSARYRINFTHSITSKGKSDAFSSSLEKMTDSFNSGPIYMKDIMTYCYDKNLKKIPTMHEIGSPKSDSLFDHTIDQEKFLGTVGLDPKKKTIMYAPTWNQGTSLLGWIDQILIIPEKFNANLIIKIHPGMYNDPSHKKSSGGVDWKSFFDNENLKKRGIVNVFEKDSTDYIMASDITITDISTIWIEYYFLRKSIIFIDVPDFFKKHEMNSLGDFRDKYGYIVKNNKELELMIEEILLGRKFKKNMYDIDDSLLYNKGHSTSAAINKIKKMYEKK